MARGTQFQELVLSLRAELRRSQSPAIGVEDLPVLKRALNVSYAMLKRSFKWPHLRTQGSISLVAGQRYYDFPDDMDLEDVWSSRVKWGGTFHVIERGITLDDYSEFDSTDDQRSDPVLKWDAVVGSSTATGQVEVWPIPASTSTLYFQGGRSLAALVDGTDICWLDDDLVVAFAAARILTADKAADAKLVQQMAQDLLRLHKVESSEGTRTRIGLGSPAPSITRGVTVTVSS